MASNESEPKSGGEKCPKGVSMEMFQKFQRLKATREKLSRGSTQKRVLDIQASVLDKVKAEMCSKEEIKTLEENGVDLDMINEPQKKKSKHKADERNISQPSRSPEEKNENSTQSWSGIQKYIGCNDHLKGLDKGRHAPKSSLENKLDDAVARKDYDEADRLNDQLASRQLGVKITEAIDAKRFDEQKKRADEIAREKRQKKLPWGFTEKKRWETKSNM